MSSKIQEKNHGDHGGEKWKISDIPASSGISNSKFKYPKSRNTVSHTGGGNPPGTGRMASYKKASPKAASKKATAIQPRTRGIPAAVYGTGVSNSSRIWNSWPRRPGSSQDFIYIIV
jgi:hypothetical protein